MWARYQTFCSRHSVHPVVGVIAAFVLMAIGVGAVSRCGPELPPTAVQPPASLRELPSNTTPERTAAPATVETAPEQELRAQAAYDAALAAGLASDPAATAAFEAKNAAVKAAAARLNAVRKARYAAARRHGEELVDSFPGLLDSNALVDPAVTHEMVSTAVQVIRTAGYRCDSVSMMSIPDDRQGLDVNCNVPFTLFKLSGTSATWVVSGIVDFATNPPSVTTVP